MNIYRLIILILFIVSSCKTGNKEIIIQGNFPIEQNATIELSKLEDQRIELKVENIINGNYALRLNDLNKGFYKLKISWPNLKLDTTISPSGKIFTSGHLSLSTTIYINGDESRTYNVKLIPDQTAEAFKQLTSKNIFKKLSLKVMSTSPNSRLYDSLNRKLKDYQISNMAFSDSLSILRDRALSKKDMNTYKFISNRMADLWKVEILPEMLAERRLVFNRNKHLVIVPYLISNATDLQQHFEEYSQILKNLEGEAADSEYAKIAFDRLNSLKNVGVSRILPKPIGIEPNGSVYHFDLTKSKLTLIEFWASWCAPCRASNPMLIGLYNKYKTKGFDILSVSLDVDKENWKKAINDDRLPWKHVSDLKDMSRSANTGRFNIVEIPQNFLIDSSGSVIAINIYGQALNNRINAILTN